MRRVFSLSIHWALAIPCALVMLAAGCASTPESRLYTLSPVPTTPAPAPAALSVAVGPVSVPAVVDRPQIVVSLSPNRVWLDEFNRWAAPLQNNIARVVAENLVGMLGTPRAALYSQTVSADADYRVAIAVQSFDSAPGEAATLDAMWTVSRAKDGKSQTGRTSVREPTTEKGYDALAAAHSRAVARLSRDIAEAVRSLDSTAK
jgi:uncharacterized lipoprotein YmbA